MALVKLGPLVAEIRGSIGGTTFARNRGGAYARNRSVPLNPSSTRQQAVRAVFADLSVVWSNTLTQAQRDAWDNYADQVPLINALGESRKVSGLNMYQRANTLLLDTGGTRVDTAPTQFTVGPTITPTFTVSAANDSIGITNLGNFTPGANNQIHVLVSASPSLQPGVSFFRSPFRKIDGRLYDAAGDVPVASVALNFPLAVGQAIFLRAIGVTPTGRVGVPTIQRFLAS